jgi:hypothetical protein
MSRLLFVFLISISSLFAEVKYEYRHQFVLKKDELGFVHINRKEIIKKATAENPMNDYLLKLRWTLFANNQLFLLVNYRGHPYQYVLKKNYPLESVMLPLLPEGADKMNAKVFIKIVFNDFNQSNKEAILDIFIEDNQERIQVEFKPKKN